MLFAAVLAYAIVFALREWSENPAEGIDLLYIVPVALVALELGFLAGLGAALGGIILTVLWRASEHLDVLSVANLTRAVALLAVGGLAGWFSDRMRSAQHRQQLLLQSGMTLTRLGNDDGLAAALAEQAGRLVGTGEVRVEMGDADDGGPPVDDGLRIPLEAGGVRYGTLSVTGSRPLGADDRTALAILALQAAVAAENARLLLIERERAVMRAELRAARRQLDDRAFQLREMIDRVEAERNHVAHELHEQAAQMLAGVLLELAALDRQPRADAGEPSLEQLRSDIGSTMQSLRALAVGLKPSALALGLETALHELVAARTDCDARTVSVAGTDELDPATGLLVYRVVEEALQAVPVATGISVRTDAHTSRLVTEIDSPAGGIEPERLAILSARIDLLGGELNASGTRLHATVPLDLRIDEAGNVRVAGSR